MATDAQDQSVERMVVDAIAEMGPERSAITRDATFEALDVDSLDLVELAQMAEEQWGVEIDPKEMSEVSTVGQAIDFIAAQTS